MIKATVGFFCIKVFELESLKISSFGMTLAVELRHGFFTVIRKCLSSSIFSSYFKIRKWGLPWWRSG